jgi:CRISPR-associated endonuclease/helicase Cas3
MKPLHAGLLGVDVLWLFDEAHLSQAFVRTVRETRLFQPRVSSAEGNGSALFQTVTLSATQTTQSPFGLEEDDISDPVLGRRLRATKYAELVAVPGNAMDGAFTEALAERAWRMSRAGGGGGAVVAVVVNGSPALALCLRDCLQRVLDRSIRRATMETFRHSPLC